MTHTAELIQSDDGHDVICPECGLVGSADERELAELVKRLHDQAFALTSEVAS